MIQKETKIIVVKGHRCFTIGQMKQAEQLQATT